MAKILFVVNFYLNRHLNSHVTLIKKFPPNSFPHNSCWFLANCWTKKTSVWNWIGGFLVTQLTRILIVIVIVVLIILLVVIVLVIFKYSLLSRTIRALEIVGNNICKFEGFGGGDIFVLVLRRWRWWLRIWPYGLADEATIVSFHKHSNISIAIIHLVNLFLGSHWWSSWWYWKWHKMLHLLFVLHWYWGNDTLTC